MRRALSLLAVVGLIAVAGCGTRGDLNASTDYCALVTSSRTVLARVPETQTDVDALVRSVAALTAAAPVAVNDEWEQLASLVDYSATVDLNDPAAPQELTDRAYAAANATKRIHDHAAKVCSVDLPDIGVVPSAVNQIAPPTVES